MRAQGLVVAVALAVAALGGLGCGGGALAKIKVDPTEQWISAGKKVDFAIADTKIMIQKSHGTDFAPDLQMRLAELYSERARYAWLVGYEKQRAKGEDTKAVDSPEARLLKNLAIGTYARVVREFPTYPRNDEALFLSGHEYRELGDFDKMTETYLKLISTYPNSPHVLEVYLALGDHAFDQNDTKTAEGYYQKILAAPASPVHALARYKLAWIRISQQDCRAAVTLFETVLRDKNAKPGAVLLKTQKDLNVMREALVDLSYCYPEVYPDRPPVEYFRSLATLTGDYLAAMRRLAARYVVKEMPANAAVAYREVLDNAPGDDDSIEMARRLHNSVTKGNAYDHPGDDVGRLVYALDARLADYRVAAPAKAKLEEEFELYTRDLATRAQLAVKDKPSDALQSAVADAYKIYLERFGTSAAAPDIRQNWAETLLAAKRYYEAGQAYAQVAATSPKTDDTKRQARLNAVAAYQKALEAPALPPADRAMAWGAVRTLGRGVITDSPADPAILSIKLGVARSYYEAGDYETAANLFYAVARQYPSTNEGAAAAHLSLDSLRLADNLEGIETLGRRLVADTRIAADVRQELNDIVLKAGQRQLAEVSASDTGDREEQLLALAKRHQGSQLGEEALYNSLAVAKSNGDTERFYSLGDEFLATYPNSPKRSDVLSGLASVASDGADFAKAAKYLSTAYDADPQGKEALDRLYSAATIHAVLGDPAVAAEAKTLNDRGNPKVDDLLVLVARSGNLSALEGVLASPSISSPTATFFRGYLAFSHNDYATANATFAKLAGAPPDLTGRAQFLEGEMAYADFRSVGTKDDMGATIDANVKALAAVTKAFKPVIEGGEIRWAMAGLARVADANMKFAAFLRGLQMPANMSAADQANVKQALGAQADEAEKRATGMRDTCVKEAKKHELFSQGARSCLLGESLPDTIPMYPSAGAKGGAEPATAAPLHKALLKNPKDVNALLKLAEMHLGMGDAGVALLLAERATQAAPKSADAKNLHALALYAVNEPQDAGDTFKEAVALEPNEPHWHLNLAAHYGVFGHVDRAKAEMQKAGTVPAAPRSPSDHPDVGVLARLGGGGKGGK
jgi:cellulose synthase operon protein C